MHKFVKKDSRWLRIAPDVLNSRPGLCYANDNIRPYWKSSGTGTERLMIETEVDGSLLLRATNTPEGGVTKETWVHLDREMASQIGAFLRGVA
jgi:hypothetical protein